jgi:hypothetical protein
MSYKYGSDYPVAMCLPFRFCPDCCSTTEDNLRSDVRKPGLRGNGFEPCQCLEPYAEPADYKILSPLSGKEQVVLSHKIYPFSVPGITYSRKGSVFEHSAT